MTVVFAVRSWPTALFLAAVAMVSCDSVPSADPDGGEPASVTSFSFSPRVIDLASLPAEQQTDSTVTISFSIEVSVRVGDAPVESVQYILQGLEIGDDPVVRGDLDVTGGSYRTDFELVLDKGAIGNYSLLIFAIDAAGLMSNRARGTLRFGSSVPVGGPPVIIDVEADPEIIRPPTNFRLIATVTDPEGLSNILKVEGTAPNGSTFGMFDDGQSFGDEVADDGRYTASFEVPSASPGVQVFRIQAFDRGGLASEVFEKEVTIE